LLPARSRGVGTGLLLKCPDEELFERNRWNTKLTPPGSMGTAALRGR